MSSYLIIIRYQDFSLGVNLWGDALGKIAKNCMKITKSRFLGQNHGGHEGEQANFLNSGDKILPVPPKQGKS